MPTAFLRDRLVRALLPTLEAKVRALLLPRFDTVREARAEAASLTEAIQRVEHAATQLQARLDRGPFHGGMTVHAAHARHPGVAAVFAKRGLPGCPDCAVGADESLTEAARGEGLPLDAILAELNSLLR